MNRDGGGTALSLYVHIPFCVKKCDYCDFLSFPADAALQARYFEALREEIRAAAGKDAAVQSIFFGGGTPSYPAAEEIVRTLETLRACFRIKADAEITLELNPGTASEEKLAVWRRAGVNRLSIGAQSMDDDMLRLLGRIHTVRDFQQTFTDARRAGFDNINVDLMSALPGQTYAGWMETLSRTAALSPEHISAYSLIIEEGTPFYERYGEPSRGGEARDVKQTADNAGKGSGGGGETERTADNAGKNSGSEGEAEKKTDGAGESSGSGDETEGAVDNGGKGPGSGKDTERLKGWPPLPDEETERRMYADTASFLEAHGYHRYEISNYARNDSAMRSRYECRQNKAYWNRGAYLGFGLGAASLRHTDGQDVRWENTRVMTEYLEAAKKPAAKETALHKNIQLLSRREQMEEFMFLGLRLTDGISKRRFSETFGESCEAVYGAVIGQLTANGLLAETKERLRLTERGIDVSNRVLAEFLF